MAGGTVRYTLVADASGFKRGVAEAQSAFDKFGQSIATGLGIGAGFAVAEKAAEALGGAIKGVASAIVESTAKAVAYGSAIYDMSLKTGISATALQRLEAAGKTAGVSLDSISSAVSKMQRNLAEGNNAFQRLGLSLADLKRMSPEQQFQKIGETIAKLGTPAEKAAAAIAIFGKAGAGLLPVFNELDQAMARAQDRVVMTDVMVAGLDKTGDAASALQEDWTDLWTNIGATIATSPGVVAALDAIAAAVRDMSRWVIDNRAEIQSWITAVVAPLADVAVTAARGIVFMADAFKMLGDKIRELPGLPDWLKSALGKGSAGMDPGWLGVVSGSSTTAGKKGGGGSFQGKGGQKEAATMWGYNLETLVSSWNKVTKAEAEAAAELQKFLDKYGSIGALDTNLKPFEAKFSPKAEMERATEDIARANAKILDDLVKMGEKWLNIGDLIGQAGAVLEAFGISADSVLGKLVSGLSLAAQSAGSFIKSFAKGDVFGMIGAGLGFLGGIGGLFGIGKGKKERKETEQGRNQFIESMGGLDALKAKAKEANVSLDALFDARKAKELEAAIGGIKGQLDKWDEATQKTNEAIERYGFTIDELGPRLSQQRLDEQFGQLYQDFNLLTQAGIDQGAILERMGPSVNDYIAAVKQAGGTIPEAMRPILQQFLDAGQLTDEFGNKLESLDGLTFAETLTEQVQKIVDAVESLVAALAQAANGFELLGNVKVIEPGNANGPPKPFTNGMAEGGEVQARPGGVWKLLGEGGENEYVIPKSKLIGMIGGGGSITVNVNGALDPRTVGEQVAIAIEKRRSPRLTTALAGVRG